MNREINSYFLSTGGSELKPFQYGVHLGAVLRPQLIIKNPFDFHKTGKT